MAIIQINVETYGPEPSDATPAAYLLRCGEAMSAEYGYDYSIQFLAEHGLRQLQISINDEGSPGGRRVVVVIAPEPVVDVQGEVMTQSAFEAKYGTP